MRIVCVCVVCAQYPAAYVVVVGCCCIANRRMGKLAYIFSFLSLSFFSFLMLLSSVLQGRGAGAVE